MKRLSVLLFLVFALCFCLISCADEGDKTPVETNPPIGNTGDPAFDDVIPDEEFEYPENPKKFVVNYIRKMAMTSWTPEKTFQLYGKYQAWSYNLTYSQGTKYYGPPFLTDSRGTAQEFGNSIVDGVYVGPTDGDCIGSACYDAVYVSLIQVCPSISFESTADMLPKNETGLLPVGDWNWTISRSDTQTIMAAHKLSEMAQYYAMLTPGDVVLKHIVAQDAGHARIVSGGPVVYKNSDGTINSKKSYITCIEQTNAWDKTVSHNTTWWVDHMYTFDELYKTNFVPLTPADYTKDVTRAAVTAKNITPAEKIAKARRLEGEIESNHFITQITVKIAKANGNTVYEHSYFPNTKTVFLEEIGYKANILNYESGTYRFTIDVSLAFGTKNVADYTFELE